jgi:hypothetical protein
LDELYYEEDESHSDADDITEDDLARVIDVKVIFSSVTDMIVQQELHQEWHEVEQVKECLNRKENFGVGK